MRIASLTATILTVGVTGGVVGGFSTLENGNDPGAVYLDALTTDAKSIDTPSPDALSPDPSSADWWSTDRAFERSGNVAPAPLAIGITTPQDYNAPYDGLFHFFRVQYSSGGRRGGFGRFRGGRGGAMWAHDYPRAERNFLSILDETTYVPSQTGGSNVYALSDPELFKFPIAYIVEVGSWNPTEDDVAAIGDYLLKGGFLIVDDTRGERGYEFGNFADHMERALPGLSLQRIDHGHEIFDSFFRIDPLAVIPPYGPRDVQYWGIFEDNDPAKRMMVMFNFNNDIAEYWEFSDRGYYPIDLANEAYKLGVNYVVYALTH